MSNFYVRNIKRLRNEDFILLIINNKKVIKLHIKYIFIEI